MEDNVTERSGSGEPTEFRKSPKKAAVSGWIGSVLEYYDFSIYAPAAALVFPAVFFPKGNRRWHSLRPWPPTPSATWPGRSGRRSWGTGATGTAARTSWSCA